MKISCGRPTYMRSQKESPLVLVHLSESGLLFPFTLPSKYSKALSSHTLITAVLFGMVCRNSLVINYKIALSDLSLNQAMIRVPDIFLIPLVGTTFPSEGRNKRPTQCIY